MAFFNFRGRITIGHRTSSGKFLREVQSRELWVDREWECLNRRLYLGRRRDKK